MQSNVNAIVGDSYTPLAETQVTALNYYSTTGGSAPIQASCQKSFVVFVTDGMPTKDANIPAYLIANDCGTLCNFKISTFVRMNSSSGSAKYGRIK